MKLSTTIMILALLICISFSASLATPSALARRFNISNISKPAYNADPFHSLSECPESSCLAQNGVPRTPDDTSSCACKACFPGFGPSNGSSDCSMCSRLALITVMKPSLLARNIFSSSTTNLEWSTSLRTSLAEQLGVAPELVLISLLTKIYTGSRAEVVFELLGNCADSQSATNPSAPKISVLESAWISKVTLDFLQSQPSFVAMTQDPTSFSVQEPTDLATCGESQNCPAYAPVFSCQRFPTHSSCALPWKGDNADILIIISVVAVIAIGLVVALVLAVLCFSRDVKEPAKLEEKPVGQQHPDEDEDDDGDDSDSYEIEAHERHQDLQHLSPPISMKRLERTRADHQFAEDTQSSGSASAPPSASTSASMQPSLDA